MGVSDLQRQAWSTLDIKAIDADQRIIEGIASTPTPDDGGDVMESGGAMFTLPLPLLWNHKQDQPIGEVFEARVRPDGIYVKARIAKVEKPGRLKERIDEAWDMLQAKLVRGLSIGWKPVEAFRSKAGGIHAKRWLWRELSAVVIPMNREASILSVKSCDAASLAASGNGDRIPSSSRARGSQKQDIMNPIPISEQLTQERNTLRTKSERLEELIQQEDTEGALSAEEATERDTLTAGVEALTVKIKRLQALEAAQAAQASAILNAPSPEKRTWIQVVDHVKELAKGTLFTRYAMAVAAGKGSYSDTVAYAKRWESQTPQVLAYIKAEAGTATPGSPAWGSELIPERTLVSEFVELLRARTVLGRLQGTRRAPTRVNVQVQTGGSTFGWVGEGGVKPVGELAFETLPIGEHKIAGIIVLTEELVRSSSPDAESTVRQDLIEQAARFIDVQLLTPGVSAGATNPASLTNGVSSPAASGTDADALYVDLNTALATFDGDDMGTESVHIVTTPAIARGISTLRTSLGVREFPEMTPNGGSLLGFPVIVSSSVPSGHLILIKANEIFIAGDERVRLDASNQATLDMAGGSSPTFNLWQRNCIGIRAEQFITWVKRRDNVVAVIDTATYGPSVGSP